MTHIDEDSATFAESMRVLRPRSNARVPISRLPDDVLMIVFKYFEEEMRLDGFNNDDDEFASDVINDVPACLPLTHVCRHWRKVALDYPTLWRFISSISPLWLDVILERSKNVPLVVSYTLFSMSRKDCVEKVLLHLPRIKHSQLRSFAWDDDFVMDLLLSHPAPVLETFKFIVYGSLPPTVSISDTIFQGQAPLLRDLEVAHCDRRWSSCIFGRLRTLRVGETPLPDLISALRCMPALEQLTIQLPTFDETMLFDRMPLARLKSIALDGTSLQTAVSLFAHLALSVDVKITLRFSSIEGPRTFADLFSVMDKHPNVSGPVFRSLRAIKSKPWCFAVQFSTSTAINSDYSWNPQEDDIRLSIQFYYRPVGVQPNGLPAVQPDIIFDICQIITQR